MSYCSHVHTVWHFTWYFNDFLMVSCIDALAIAIVSNIMLSLSTCSMGNCIRPKDHDKLYIFKVKYRDNQRNVTRKGHMIVTANELTYFDNITKEKWEWPHQFIRKYRWEGNVFSFEAGRNCANGEGKYDFTTKDAHTLYTIFASYVTRTRHNLSYPPPLPPPSPRLSRSPRLSPPHLRLLSPPPPPPLPHSLPRSSRHHSPPSPHLSPSPSPRLCPLSPPPSLPHPLSHSSACHHSPPSPHLSPLPPSPRLCPLSPPPSLPHPLSHSTSLPSRHDYINALGNDRYSILKVKNSKDVPMPLDQRLMYHTMDFTAMNALEHLKKQREKVKELIN